ncbi:MAG: response regulator [Longimicrobiales bacterium]|nr:response regulator [Longimicrobiales bacterium]
MADIIIIDDEEALRSTMRKILERAGHEVREAADGDRGIELVRERVADLVITDIFMPGKEGMETIQELKEEFPDVRILAVSGGATLGASGPLMDAELFGANGSLAKPFTVESLQNAVTEVLDGAEGS